MHRPAPEVYSSGELARAAGIPLEQIEALVATGELPSVDGRWIAHADAVAWGRRLGRSAVGPSPAEPLTPPELFEAHHATRRDPVAPAAVSAAFHGLAIAGAVLITTVGLGSAAAARTEYRVNEPMRLVYLNLPGPGGGGGGGGLRQPKPPPPAKRKGERPLSSPLPDREPPPPVEPPKVEAPPPEPAQEKLPPVVAPVVTSPSDDADRAGVLEKSPSAEESRGPGEGGGVGNGKGVGIGEGDGSGIGPGSGGGTGGGPYRPGSGIEPPRLLREVKPEYTEEARRRNITGDVVLEIVVTADGRVGDVRVLDGLGYGLDARAVEAVRQWRFSPAHRLGKPVDVIVEVAVTFRLR